MNNMITKEQATTYMLQARSLQEWNLMLRDVRSECKLDQPVDIHVEWDFRTGKVDKNRQMIVEHRQVDYVLTHPHWFYELQADGTLQLALKNNINWRNNPNYKFKSLEQCLK